MASPYLFLENLDLSMASPYLSFDNLDLSLENLDPSTAISLPDSCYSEATALWAANAHLSLVERDAAVIRFFKEKENALLAMGCLEVLGDEEKDGGMCKLLSYEKEHSHDQVGQDGQRCMKSGMTDSSENRIKENCSHVTSEYLAALAQKIMEDIKESRSMDKAVVSSGFIDGNKEERIGEIKKMPFQLLGHEKKHARNKGQVAVDAEQETKKARMVASSTNNGEDVETL